MKNIGAIAAFNIRLYCGGGLEDDLDLPLAGQPDFEPHMPRQMRQYKFIIRPSRKVPLRIDIHYQDYLRKFPPLQTTLLVPIEIDDALVLQTGNIGYLKLESVQNLVVQTGNGDIDGIRLEQGVINQVEAGGNIGFVSGAPAQRVCQACGKSNSAGKSFCENCGTNVG